MDYKKRKIVALSVVALLLAFTITVGVSFSWIDDVKQVEFQNSNLTDNNAPLKTGVDINAGIKITKNENTINLGNILENSDLVYNYSEQGESETKAHVKYDGTVAASKPVWTSPTNSTNPTDSIERKKGYFYESGDMHLSGCFSDGEAFYFPRRGASGYREGNKDDENVNYISMTFKVSSPDASTDFWFKEIPKIIEHGTNNEIDNARYAIIVDGETHVYSNSGYAFTANAGLSGTTAVSGVRKTSNYTYGDTSNTTDDRGANSNTLFSIKKGDTVNMTVKIWLEGGYNTSIKASDINFKLVSSWAYTRTITIKDKTTSADASSWVRNHNATLFLTVTSILKDMGDTPGYWDDLDNDYDYVPFYPLTLVSGTTDTYTVTVPLVYNNEEMFLYRCTDQGWNKKNTSQTSNGADAAQQRSDYNVYCWNWWKTYIPNTFRNETYTLYGSSYDNVASGQFGGTATNKGYGTWGSVEQINVYSHYGGTEYATKADGARLYIRDHSDEDTSGEIYTYVMYREDNNSSTPWKAYVPVTSAKIHFVYKYGDAYGEWGYKSWYNYDGNNAYNPQRRPLASTGLYYNSSNTLSHNYTTYHFARNFGGNKGWGYWEGADHVYLIKTGFLVNSSNLYGHMFDYDVVHLKTNDNWETNSPKFVAHFENGSNSYDVTMTKIDTKEYIANKPDGTWSNIVFKRCNSSDGTIWNYTSNLTFNNGQEYTLASDAWSEGGGSWSEYKKSDFPGETFERMQDASGNNVSKQYSDTVSREVYTSKYDARVYRNIIFSNGSNSNQSNTLVLFPGCFYEPDNTKTNPGKWYGSLNDTGTGASSYVAPTTTQPTTAATVPTVPAQFTIQTTDPSTNGVYAYGNLSGGSSNTEYVKFTQDSSGGYVLLYLEAGKSYTLQLRKRSGNFTNCGGQGSVTLSEKTVNSQAYNMNSSDPTHSITINSTYSAIYKVQIENYQSWDVSYTIRFNQYNG